ncbi:MAG: hypothetical protein QOH71_3680 [Blastocatellia bacterium]|nr:hypothetical protein [Blastocatellia bacterium]
MIVVVLVIALVSSGTLDKSGCVDAKTCDEAMADYFNANSTYFTARVSYFYGEPTTCQQDCQGSQNPTQCVNDCQINRHTELGNAEMGLFSLALDTCTPISMEQCAQARAMADDCVAQYDLSQYSDLEERLAVSAQLMACREASKIDSCQ